MARYEKTTKNVKFAGMKTVYANTTNRKLTQWGCTISFILGIGLFVLYIILQDASYRVLLYIASFCLLQGALFFGMYKLKAYEIDDEEDTITDFDSKKYPLHISQLKSATYKESKKGRFRSLFLHDTGIGFMDIHTSKEKADQIVSHLLRLNPEIEVKHAHYL